MEQVRLIIQERRWSKRTYAIQHKIGFYMKRITMSLRCISCLVLKVMAKMTEYWLLWPLMEKKSKATSFFWMQSHLKRLIEHICHILFHGLPMECIFPKQNLLCNKLMLLYFEYYDCYNNNALTSSHKYIIFSKFIHLKGCMKIAQQVICSSKKSKFRIVYFNVYICIYKLVN